MMKLSHEDRGLLCAVLMDVFPKDIYHDVQLVIDKYNTNDRRKLKNILIKKLKDAEIIDENILEGEFYECNQT